MKVFPHQVEKKVNLNQRSYQIQILWRKTSKFNFFNIFFGKNNILDKYFF